MNVEDDDLPVLTHVLRTGNGPLPLAVDADFDDAFQAHFDVLPADDGPLHEIVIGHEVPRPLVFADAATGEARTGQPTPADPFRLAQDVDAMHSTSSASIAEQPHIETVVDPFDTEPVLDTPLDFSRLPDTAAWAARVRESVMTDLADRIDTELDARIAQAMHLEVESAIAQLQSHLRSHLTDALRDVVARAVDDEIARIGLPAAGPDRR